MRERREAYCGGGVVKSTDSLYAEFREKGRFADCPVYDMHAHMGEFRGMYIPFPEPAEMVRRMERAGVKMAAFSHHLALSSPDAGNGSAIAAARKYPGRLKVYCVVNPHYPEMTDETIQEYPGCGDVCAGLKLHPDAHKVALTDGLYARAMEFADRNELLVLSHTWGGSSYCGAAHVREIAGRYTKLKFIMGHSIHGEWDEAAAIAAEHENVYLELCAVLDERAGILEKLVAAAGSDKILFGTDFPWFSHHYYIAGVLAAGISDDDRRNIFYRNAVKLLGLKTPGDETGNRG